MNCATTNRVTFEKALIFPDPSIRSEAIYRLCGSVLKYTKNVVQQ